MEKDWREGRTGRFSMAADFVGVVGGAVLEFLGV
jgi:hypothetical protein